MAARFGIPGARSACVWSHDDRYRGGIAVDDERRAPRTNDKVPPRPDQEGMTPEEEPRYLRMENAVQE